MKLGKNWLRIAEIYRRFSKDYPQADFSEQSAIEMYRHETFGDTLPGEWNGYALGKKWMDVTIAMWKEDIEKGLLFLSELQIDYPDWFLKRIGLLKG